MSTPTLATLAAKLDKVLEAVSPPTIKPVYIVQHTPESVTLYGSELRPGNWMGQPNYNDRPTPRPEGPDRWKTLTGIPLGNVANFAKLAARGGTVPFWAGAGKEPDSQFFAGAPQYWDFEAPAPYGYNAATAYFFEMFLDTARANAPGVKIGLTDFPDPDIGLEAWARGPTAAELTRVRAGLAPFRGLLGKCDFACAGMYPAGPQYLARDIAAIRNLNRFFAGEYAVPVHCWLRPTYDGGPATPDAGPPLPTQAAADLFGAARDTSDAIVIYGATWAVTKSVLLPLLATVRS